MFICLFSGSSPSAVLSSATLTRQAVIKFKSSLFKIVTSGMSGCIHSILMTFNHDHDRQARRGWLWTASPGPPSTPKPSEWHFLQRFAAATFLIRLASVYFWLNLVFCKPQILIIFHSGGDEEVGRGRRRRGSSWACWR